MKGINTSRLPATNNATSIAPMSRSLRLSLVLGMGGATEISSKNRHPVARPLRGTVAPAPRYMPRRSSRRDCHDWRTLFAFGLGQREYEHQEREQCLRAHVTVVD